MNPWRIWRGLPDANGVYEAAPIWNTEIIRILDILDEVAQDSADEAAHAFLRRTAEVKLSHLVQASLQSTRNLLMGIPDEIARMIFDNIAAGLRANETNEAIAARVDDLLITTGSPRWPNRAQLITRTELTRAWGAGRVAYGLHIQQRERQNIYKRWDAREDNRDRPAHRAADGQTVLVSSPFQVGGEQLMWPGDATGAPDNVINCRCSTDLLREEDI